MTTFEKIRDMIADQLGIAPANITMESHLLDDLKADSLSIMELVMNVEEEYDLEVSTDAIKSMRTVSDIVNYIDSLGKN